MFDSIGEKIKKYAEILFVIDVIISLIGAGYIGFGIVSGIMNGAVGFLVFLLLAAVFIVWSYLSVIFIYGFGDLVDNAERIRANVESARWSDRVEVNAESERKRSAPVMFNLGGKPIFKDHETARKNTESGWKCMRCGAQNENRSSKCSNCGMQRT